MLVVGATAVAFVLLIVLGRVIDLEEERRLADLEGRLLPKLELGPQLDADLQAVRRSIQDAVAAQDTEDLERTQQGLATFLRRLDDAAPMLDSGAVASLRAAVEDYYRTAFALSRRLIGGETGESLTEAIAVMQGKQNQAFGALERTVRLDRRELTANFAAVRSARSHAARVRLFIGIGCLVFAMAITVWLSGGALRALRELSSGFARFGRGDFSQPVVVTTRDEFGAVSEAANHMARSLQQLGAERDHNEWLTRGQARLADELRGELTPGQVGTRVSRFLAAYLEAPAAAFYTVSKRGDLELLGQYALGDSREGNAGATTRFRQGEGLVGQAALGEDLVVVDELPPNYLRVRSGLGEQQPSALVLMPVVNDGLVRGVTELALFRKPPAGHREFLLSVRETLAIAVAVAEARVAMQTLLAETQRQAALLSSQEEELRSNNEELQAQQEELRQSNEELEEQQRTLERQNRSLEEARGRLQKQAEELITVSTYKSRFLANMSHELRTPLNSMLILSNLLAQNESGNLTAKQVEYCRTVHSAGRDLLALINQVLDLAKIEAGKQEVNQGPVKLADLADYARRLFLPLATDKGLHMAVEMAADLPETIVSDQRRIEQILTNLVGNAIKFTPQGTVTLHLGRGTVATPLRRKDLEGGQTIAISVTDTGVGIAKEDQERIFSPFEQAEAQSDRRYGGTGLGLTIARELSSLLGGELQLSSTPGQGSTFTLYLPISPPAILGALGASPGRSASTVPAGKPQVIERRGGVLVVEDDVEKGESLTALLAAEGFDPTHVTTGGAGLAALEERRFGCLILDLGLPDMDGVAFLETLEKKAGMDSPPVLIHTGRTLSRPELQRLQAYAHAVVLKEGRSTERLLEEVRLFVQQLEDPGKREQRPASDPFLTGVTLVIADDDMRTAYALAALLRSRGAEVLMADTGEAALELLDRHPEVKGVVTDLMMPAMDGYETLRRIRGQPRFAELPIIALSAKMMKGEKERCLEAGATAYLPKPVDSDLLLELLRTHLGRTTAPDATRPT
jgi:signal transduction histidine kinase/CheY-like chemotaxis protein/HAMP domain-containing protein